MYDKISMLLPNLDPEEAVFIQNSTKQLSDDDFNQFIMIYKGKRRDPQLILITTLLGFVVVAGVQRFLVNQIGMGILYLLTAGLCFVGTIIDLINYKKMALEYNQQMITESLQLMSVMKR